MQGDLVKTTDFAKAGVVDEPGDVGPLLLQGVEEGDQRLGVAEVDREDAAAGLGELAGELFEAFFAPGQEPDLVDVGAAFELQGEVAAYAGGGSGDDGDVHGQSSKKAATSCRSRECRGGKVGCRWARRWE